jgi:putative phage-type endonuclease
MTELSPLRKLDVTSTDVATLFNASPYQSYYKLWMRKAGRIEHDSDEMSERMECGLALEEAIAQYAAQRHGWRIERFDEYMRNEELRIGSSFDFITDDNKIVEIKNVDLYQFNNLWYLAPPIHIELQVQHQLLVSGLSGAIIVAMVGGNSLRIYERGRDEGVHNAIVSRVRAFWDDIKGGNTPEPDFERDAALITEMRRTGGAGVKDGGPDMSRTAARYDELSKEIRTKTKELEKLRAEILYEAGEFDKIECSDIEISISAIAGSPGRVITEEDIGTVIGERKPYRRICVKNRRNK